MTISQQMAILGCMSLIAASNAILLITGVLSLPLYFSFYGSEAAVRFSLLLCMHSCILAAVPSVLVSNSPPFDYLSSIRPPSLTAFICSHFIPC